MKERIVDFTETSLKEVYGSNCFNDLEMKSRLPKSIYKEFKKIQNGDKEMSLNIAEVIAGAMKDWAMEKGATHYTHWFQPLTGLTAEKHDSFINPTGEGSVMMEFSGKELIQGEPDASSFPNGGLRETFEARGYTAWDITSPAFLKEDNSGTTLYIPTAFVSYTGEALDKKVPLLRSMDVLGDEALRVLRALGNTTTEKVTTTVGAEQEYFLIDKEYYQKRSDLKLAGRTLFGKLPAKGQEMDDHYFGTIKERVAAFMRELDTELWRLGVSAKTKHNEVAPNQFEIAAVFSSSNVATDQNQLVMDTIRKVAGRHDLVALLHEKPFAGINGSGKHNNWSMGTDDGMNLLEPGSNPEKNKQFLLFTAAVIKAVDMYAPMLRLSAGNAGNDHRLGANEAPPAIISIFLGGALTTIFEKIANGKKLEVSESGKLSLGTDSIPEIPKDLTDRNRTSPFAFTGNKFEFRMPASSQSISGPNVILNTVVADVLGEIADKLEKASDIDAEINNVIRDIYKEHGRVVFDGDGYSDDWIVEAEKRGLANLKTTVDALPVGIADHIVEVFSKRGIFTKEELISRYNAYSEAYSMQVNIEAGLVVEIANTQIFPAANDYAKKLADTIQSIKSVSKDMDTSAQERVLEAVNKNIAGLKEEVLKLEEALVDAQNVADDYEQAVDYKDNVLPKLNSVRVYADNLEALVDKKDWPFPTYEELLYNL
ncbi:MAG: glutamine synthetase III [Fusobacteriota bacterium]